MRRLRSSAPLAPKCGSAGERRERPVVRVRIPRCSRFTGGMTELYAVVLDHAKRKREAGGATPGGAVEMMTRNLQLRLHLEMLDDDKVREIASQQDTGQFGQPRARTRARSSGTGNGPRASGGGSQGSQPRPESLAARIGDIARTKLLGWDREAVFMRGEPAQRPTHRNR